jgi:hypothetical protein
MKKELLGRPANMRLNSIPIKESKRKQASFFRETALSFLFVSAKVRLRLGIILWLTVCGVLSGIKSTSAQGLLRQVSEKSGSEPTSTKLALEKVLIDYPNAFKNICGEVEEEDPSYTVYALKTPFPGAIHSFVKRFNTPNGNVVSFDALMLQTEDFKQAANQYKTLCTSLKRGIIHMGKHRPYILDGKFLPPTEEKRFHETVFALMPTDDMVHRLKVVITLEYVLPHWELRIRLYDKAPDDEMVLEDEDDQM